MHSISASVFSLLALSTSAVFAQVPPTTNATAQSALYVPRNFTTIQIEDNRYGARSVSYFVTSKGNAVIDGDVVYGTEAELLSRRVNTTNTQRPPSKRAHTIFAGGRAWPGATVIYKFDSCQTEKTLATIIDAAIATWKAKSPYLNFVQLPNSATPQNGILTITANQCDGCNANIGYSSSSPLSMNLQQLGGPCSPAFCGTAEAVHEFGHVLGFDHEHQRPDRDSKIKYNCANLSPAPLPDSTDCCKTTCPLASNFDKVNGYDASGPYDLASIMHYRRDGFARPGKETLTPVNAADVVPARNPTVPSQIDHDRVCKIYNGQCGPFGSCAAPGGTCKQCSPISGQNKCHSSTSCIGTTVGKFYCACEAGMKADAADGDVSKHFRLPFPNFEFLVFVAPGVQCTKKCDVSQGLPSALCQEVQKRNEC